MADDDLRAELKTLRRELEALRAAFDNSRASKEPTMRAQLRCPACTHRRIAHAHSVLDRADNDTRKTLSLYQPSWWSSKTIGKLEAYACTRCGFVEWYVKDPAGLRAHDKHMEILDGEPPNHGGPYR